MLNKIFVLLIVLICTIGVGSATVSISGTVSESGVGLSGVTIDISGSGTSTNASGYYFVSGLAENVTHTVTASKDLYNTNTLDVAVTTSDVTNADITLSKTSLAGFMSKISQCVTSITTMFSSILTLFMEPPLVVFVGIVLFGILLGILGKHIKGIR